MHPYITNILHQQAYKVRTELADSTADPNLIKALTDELALIEDLLVTVLPYTETLLKQRQALINASLCFTSPVTATATHGREELKTINLALGTL